MEKIPPKKKAAGDICRQFRKFCWICQLEEPLFFCTTCPRVFHGQCVFEMPGYPVPSFRDCNPRPCNVLGAPEIQTKEMVQCPECIVAEHSNLDALKNCSPDVLKEVCLNIIFVLGDMYKGNPYKNIADKTLPGYIANIEHPMDLSILEELVQNGKIKTGEGFLGELKWLQHNTVIFEGRLIPILKDIRETIKQCKTELREASFCPSWYLATAKKTKKLPVDLRMEFLKPCNPPHLLAWVKYEGFPWWPAKVKWACGDGKFMVLYFGDQKISEIKVESMRLFSDDPPIEPKKQTKKLDDALKDIKEYIEAQEKLLGRVVLAEKNTPFPNVGIIKTDTLKIMFPTYKDTL